jgi:hypothetical protein
METTNFVILDPLNLTNNTTKNSYLTRDILQMFQSAFNNLKSLMYRLPLVQQVQSSTGATPPREALSTPHQQSPP